MWQVAAYQVDRVYATQVGPPAFFWMQRRLLVDLTSIYGRYFAPIAAIHTAPKAAAMLHRAFDVTPFDKRVYSLGDDVRWHEALLDYLKDAAQGL